MNESYLTASICVDDLKAEYFRTAANGKRYLNFIVSPRREVGRYGETHNLCLSRTKEQREADGGTIYIGNAELRTPKEEMPAALQPQPQQQAPQPQQQQYSDELPF